MTDQTALVKVEKPKSSFLSDHAIRLYTSFVMTLILGMAAWTAQQAVEMRDSVKSLEVSIPLEIKAITDRQNAMENRQNTVDDRLDELLMGQKRARQHYHEEEK